MGLFQGEIRKAKRGHLVFVTDEQRNPYLHSVRMRDFKERQRFYLFENHNQRITRVNSVESMDSERLNVGTNVLQSLIRKEIAKLFQLNKNECSLKGTKIHKQKKTQ